MKTLLKLLGIGAVAFFAWAAWTYPLVGHKAYALSMAVESRLYGFNKSEVDIGEMPLSVYQGGAGQGAPALVLIHGYSAENEHWLRFARHLTDRYHVIAPDMAGHGDTGFQPDWDYSMPAQAQRVAKLLDALDIQKAHIVGNSMGGYITATFALRYPQRTLSATLIDAAGVIPPQPSAREKLLAEGINVFEFDDQAGFQRFYPMTMANPPWVPGFVLDAQAEKFIARRSELAAIFEDLNRPEHLLDERLHEISAPTLVMWGVKDQLIDVSATAVWSKLPNVQIEIWDDLGHMPHVEAPKRSAMRLAEFLQPLTSGKP